VKERKGTRIAGWILGAALACGAAISGCAGGRATIPTADDLYAAGAIPTGINVAAVRKGRTVFVTECGSCHRLYLPSEYTPEEWLDIAGRMSMRASLGAEQEEDLKSYLTAASRADR